MSHRQAPEHVMAPLTVGSMLAAFVVAVALSGCATQAYAALSDFDSIKAEVRVAFDIFGPSVESARTAADPLGLEHCSSLEKSATFVSARRVQTGDYVGEYIFLYRCEGADRVRVD